MMNLLQYKTQEEFIDYLNKLTEEELIEEFNISDNLYSRLSYLLHITVITIFTKYYDKPLDDIGYHKIEDYEKYTEGYLNDLSKYLEDITNELNEFKFYVNKEELKINSMSWALKEDNSNIKEVIIAIYEKIINNNYSGIYNRLVLLISKLKKHIDSYDYLKYAQKYKEEFSIDELMNSHILENRGKLIYKPETLKIIVNDTLKVSEIISESIIDRKYDFKEYLSKENYEILEKCNLINKLSFILYSPIIGIDMADLLSTFKNKKISKIIDNSIEKNFNTVDKYTDFIYLLDSQRENVLSEIFEKSNQLKEKYSSKDYEVEYIVGLINGDKREIIIIIGE